MELAAAFVLHTRPWRDSSSLVDLFLQTEGRVRCIAHGQRRQSATSKGNICQPFQPLFVALRGKSDLKTLSRIESGGSSYRLPGQHLYAGFYANEILLRALPEADPHPVIYQAYLELLQALVDNAVDVEPPLRGFELTLLEELGYGIDFFHDADSGEPLVEAQHYLFQAEKGFVPCPLLPGAAREGYLGRDIIALGGGDLAAADKRVLAKKLMRRALQPLVGEKPLQSRMLYRPAERFDEE